jgi:hypothetical protein
MVISLTKEAWSQTGVADAAGGRVAAGSVGTDKAVFVATDKGKVGVLNGTDCVNCACTVRAAAVNTAFDSAVGVTGELDGKLHAERIRMITVKKERLRASLNM